jgi:hypothetical protein
MAHITSITVTYRMGVKRSLGEKTFSNGIIEIEESETWDVSDLDEVATELLATRVYDRLRAKIDKRVEEQDAEWQE